MVRRFRSVVELLNDLLDRHEAGIANVRAYADHEGFRDIPEADRFERDARRAASTGAVRVFGGSGRFKNRVERVDLVEADVLYRHLDRTPARVKAAGDADVVFSGLKLHNDISAMGREAVEAWSRNRQWSGILPGDTSGLRKALQLAQALAEGKHRGLDYRTFSLRTAGGSKDLERLETAVLRILSAASKLPAVGDGRAILAELGLDRFGPPLLLAGPISLDNAPVQPTLPYLGIPPQAIARIGFVRRPSYVLSIENQTSFNRQVVEVDPERNGLTLYVGGYPSVDAQRALGHLARVLPGVPFFHWSDIDPDGTWIYRTVERAVGRPIAPHLMDRSLAEAEGIPMGRAGNLRSDQVAGTAIADLVAYLETEDARWLEQEALDPQVPHVRGYDRPA